MNLSVRLEGLEFLKELKLPASSVLKEQLGTAANIYNAGLQSAVLARYEAPRSKQLSSVRVKSISLLKTGGNTIEQGIVYKEKPVPLLHFSYKEVKVAAESKWRPLGSFRVRRKTYANELHVKVFRGKSRKVKGRKGYGGFVNNKKGWGKSAYIRKQKATWSALDVRAPIKPLFGPSLASMARQTIKVGHPKLKAAENKAVDIILDSIVREL